MFTPSTNFSQNSIPTPPPAQSRPTLQTKSNDRAAETAKEFEATILAMLLKDMRQSLDPDTLFPGDTSDIQGGLFDMYMSRHLADSGGTGLAAIVARQIRDTAGSTNAARSIPTVGRSDP